MRRFFVRFAIAILGGVALAPVVGYLLPDVYFHRVLQRTIIAILFVQLLWGPHLDPRTWKDGIQSLGLTGPHRFWRFWTGVDVAAVLVALMVLVSWLVGGREPAAAPHKYGWLSHLARALWAGFVVGWLEEFAFRGYLRKHVGALLSALLYAAVHLCRPFYASAGAGPEFDPWLGVKKLPILFETWTDPRVATLGLASLFLFGLTLNRLAIRTGTLWFGVGLHAGVVFGVSYYRRFLDPWPENTWVFGGPRIYDGLLGLAGMALLYLAACRAPLPRFLRA